MPNSVPLKPSDYYDTHPLPDHRTGDIWRDLPAFGLEGREVVTGLVVTPACDLANRKCNAVTYLPVIPLREYLGSSQFRYECWQEVAPLLSKSELYAALTPPERFQLPRHGDVEPIVESLAAAKPRKLTDAELTRLRAYLDYIAVINGTAPALLVQRLMKAERYASYVDRLVTNALKSDVHFLPRDGQPSNVSAVPEHSVVLFRWPMTISVDVLEAAQESTPQQWRVLIAERAHPLRTATFVTHWPIKLSTVRSEFLGDLLARYVSMYIRLGSADFSKAAIDSMVADMRFE
jgi:hypothetical protein